jgi:Uma2 family endonuclease
METISLHLLPKLQLDDDEFYLFCQINPKLKLEKTKDGEILIMALTGGKTGAKNMALSAQLWFWNNQHQAGITFDSSTGFRLPNGAIRSPDAAWITKERWEALSESEQEKFPPLCPDFVVELKSESDPPKAAQEKMGEWLENGCRLGWLLDPQGQKAYVYHPGRPIAEWEGFTQRLSGEDVLPGFSLDLALLR